MAPGAGSLRGDAGDAHVVVVKHAVDDGGRGLQGELADGRGTGPAGGEAEVTSRFSMVWGVGAGRPGVWGTASGCRAVAVLVFGLVAV